MVKIRSSALFAVLVIVIGGLLPCYIRENTSFSEKGDYDVISDYACSDGPSTSASAVYLCCFESRSELYSQNCEEKLPMASTTKIMTGLLVCELLDLDTIVTVSDEAAGVEGSSAYLMKGEKISVRTLLYALMLQSANDAATQLAISVAGDVEKFAELMNARAKEMGLKNTHFTNPHGLDDEEHYTTAKDLADIACEALENEKLASVVSTKYYKAGIIGRDGYRSFTNHNRLLFTYSGAVGMKTGYTIRTGRCLVSAAKRDGMTLVCVSLADRNDWRDHKALLDWGFENYCIKTLANPGQVRLTLPVCGGKAESVQVVNEKGLKLFTNKDNANEISVMTVCPHFLFCEVKKGEQVGRIEFSIPEACGDSSSENRSTYCLPLIAECEVQKLKSGGLLDRLIDRIKRIFSKDAQ